MVAMTTVSPDRRRPRQETNCKNQRRQAWLPRPSRNRPASLACVYTWIEMLPYIHLGFLHVPTFGLMLWLAAVTAGLVMDRNFRRNNISADAVGMVAITV